MVATSNLAIGVVVGTLTAMVAVRPPRGPPRAGHVGHGPDGGEVIDTVHGELFFGSSSDLVEQFDYVHDPARVVIDMSGSHVWDASSVTALDAVTHKYSRYGKTVRILNMNDASDAMHGRLSGQLSSHG